jgi:hypothetical protein
MKIRVKVQENTYFIKLLLILSNIPPFNKLRPKELELYAHLLEVNHKYRNIPFKERNRLIFSYDTRIEISDKMGIKLNGVYNILSNLKLLGIIGDNVLLPKYLFTKVSELIFLFEDEE